jgi:phosphopantetheinyl transferase
MKERFCREWADAGLAKGTNEERTGACAADSERSSTKQLSFSGETRVVIEQLPESAEEAGLSRRVIEKAAWRAIVRRILGPDTVISYNAAGAPILERGRGYIGVSHTRGWVAVILSPAPCAIDIELKTRMLSPAAAARYSICSMEDWCALEATYKYAGLAGHEPPPGSVSFIDHPALIVAVIR